MNRPPLPKIGSQIGDPRLYETLRDIRGAFGRMVTYIGDQFTARLGGTVGRIPKWIDISTLGNSHIRETTVAVQIIPREVGEDDMAGLSITTSGQRTTVTAFAEDFGLGTNPGMDLSATASTGTGLVSVDPADVALTAVGGSGTGSVVANGGTTTLAATLSVGPLAGSSSVKSEGNTVTVSADNVQIDAPVVGVNEASPLSTLHVSHDASGGGLTLDTYRGGGYITNRTSAGTKSAPTAVTTSTILAGLSARGYGATAFSSGGRAAMLVFPTETWTDAAQGTQIRFYVTKTGGIVTGNVLDITNDGRVRFQPSGCDIISGSGTPEGAVVATVGCIFLRSDGGAGTTLYVKESGTGNTGWVGK